MTGKPSYNFSSVKIPNLTYKILVPFTGRVDLSSDVNLRAKYVNSGRVRREFRCLFLHLLKSRSKVKYLVQTDLFSSVITPTGLVDFRFVCSEYIH